MPVQARTSHHWQSGTAGLTLDSQAILHTGRGMGRGPPVGVQTGTWRGASLPSMTR